MLLSEKTGSSESMNNRIFKEFFIGFSLISISPLKDLIPTKNVLKPEFWFAFFLLFAIQILLKMKKCLIPLLLILLTAISLSGQQSEVKINLRYDQNYSLSYYEAIDAYKQLASKYKTTRLMEMGPTDIGKPLHLFIISNDGDFDPVSIRKKGKSIILIINGIHPGEPEGIDATIQFAWDILKNKDGIRKYLDNTVIAILPVYNIDGALNRSQYYRLNQNGPELKGSRRNAKNLDLNRDFSKQDSKNARTFAKIYHFLDPDVFLDTHTTNGSDHQYALTLIPTQFQRMQPEMSVFFREKMIPGLYEKMKQYSRYGMIPYVQTAGRGGIKTGITGFEDHPYYSTGYAALFNCFAFMTENLVYAAFPDRVRSVYDFMVQLLAFTSENGKEIRDLKIKAENEVKTQKEFVLDWSLDMTRSEKLLFKGYEYEQTTTPISKRTTGIYNHNKPWTDTIPYYDFFNPSLTVKAPLAYVIPQAWDDVILRMKINGVEMSRFMKDTTIEVESYYIDKNEPSQRATQGHFINTKTEIRPVVQKMHYFAGDYVIYVNQKSNKYIVSMLEPNAPGSFFTWNFFDPILEGGEFFSIWGFESHAKE
ncbi:MAG: hypothetical protein C0408_02160, partial [Odoribacter sp.]|nr:hypothetical protein [Odoribacter sp.]